MSNEKKVHHDGPIRTARNEGEGSRSAAKAYNEATRKFVRSGKTAEAARAAARAMSSPEATELIAAEAKGKARARH